MNGQRDESPVTVLTGRSFDRRHFVTNNSFIVGLPAQFSDNAFVNAASMQDSSPRRALRPSIHHVQHQPLISIPYQQPIYNTTIDLLYLASTLQSVQQPRSPTFISLIIQSSHMNIRIFSKTPNSPTDSLRCKMNAHKTTCLSPLK